MNLLPQSIQTAIQSLSDLPGIGNRSAERLIFALLRNESGLDQKISESLKNLRKNIGECSLCHHFCEITNSEETQAPLCEICQRPSRDKKSICVIETPTDLIALERTLEFKGLFHVLHGVISPLQKVGPEDLRIAHLFKRLQNNTEIEEVILAMSGNIESDATALYITENLHKIFKGKITRLARGIPTGGDLDYLDTGTLSRALLDRRDY
ncbi:recombination protein RecR [Candidatus Gracilibacteria bacterium]|nr:recombination protein RecR [Candidatus Gracilibacteria bacterium]